MVDGGWHDSARQPALVVSSDGTAWQADYREADGSWHLSRNGEEVARTDEQVDRSVEAAEQWLAPAVDDPEALAYLASKISHQPEP